MRCCPPPEAWVSRAQPWLGTLVEVSLPSAAATEARFAAAFAAVARVHRRMSAHDPGSDLARIARHAHRHPVRVDAHTHAVLRLAQSLARATGGLFDVTVPPRRRCRRRTGAAGAGMRALHLQAGRRVRTDAPLRLDLGGIAKGYAVDLAVAALRAAGAAAGLVNAGGDLRVFGREPWLPVRLRLPWAPTMALPLFALRDAAAATSADYFRDAPALLDPRRSRPRGMAGSVTVVAPTCALADALTKVVALRRQRSAGWLARHGAHAFHLETQGRRARTTCDEDTPRLRLLTGASA